MKYSISCYLQAMYNRKDATESQIRIRVRWNGISVQFNAGHNIDPAKWNTDQSRCKKNTSNKKGDSAFDINQEIARLESLAVEVFKPFEVADKIPTAQEYKDAFNIANGKKVGTPKEEKGINVYLHEFCSDQGTLNSWSDATLYKFHSFGKHLSKFNPDLSINDLTRQTLLSLLEYMRDTAGLQNTTIIKNWRLLTWFLRWCDKKGYLTCVDYRDFSPKMKTVADKEIVFLTWEELMKLYSFQFPGSKQYLSRVRDVFCFQCFTSLRYSDVSKLKREDIQEHHIKVVTKKTGDTLRIELNKYSSAILEKYKADEKPLPVASNQKMNDYIKEACFIVGIDTLVTNTYYRGNERIEETKPKYEFIGTHSGRRTFICNALALGIPASTVMEWTGHSDYKAMKPYIAVADKEKREAMKLFDEK